MQSPFLALKNQKPILVTGSNRSGTTWVGKMLALSPYVCYISEPFNPNSGIVGDGLIKNMFHYINDENCFQYGDALERIINYDFIYPERKRKGKTFLSRVFVFKVLHKITKFPRPILKDPVAVLSSDWLARRFQMDVLCLIRHPAAFVQSLKKLGWRFDFSSFINSPLLIEEQLHPFAEQIAHPPRDIVGESALLWKCIYYVLTNYLRKHPEWLCWRYEDIAVSPVVAFQEIYAGLALPYSGQIRKNIQEYTSRTNPISSVDPHEIKRNSAALINNWKNELTRAEVNRIRDIVEPVASLYYSEAEWSF